MRPTGWQWRSVSETERLILTDANILIDYCSVGLEILQLVSEHLAPVVVPDVVFREVRDLTEDRATSFGITVVETPLPLLDAAQMVSSKRLSFEDRVCLEMAELKRWTCATNDKTLKRECDARGISTVWGLELMIRLVDSDVLTPQRAQSAALQIHQLNPRSITATILQSFLNQIV